MENPSPFDAGNKWLAGAAEDQNLNELCTKGQ